MLALPFSRREPLNGKGTGAKRNDAQGESMAKEVIVYSNVG